MKKLGLIFAVVTSATLSACATAPTETATRLAPTTIETEEALAAPLLSSAIHIQSVQVNVPGTLEVSEKNRFYPGGDIVWRGDPPGNRYEQVHAIVEDAMLRGVRALDQQPDPNARPVMLDIEVTRFHALTEKARYTVGGVHALQFNMVLRDIETGQPLGEPKFVKADLKGYGGSKAVAAERAGQTQKVRISDHLAEVIQLELTSPDGYVVGDLGILGAINQF